MISRVPAIFNDLVRTYDASMSIQSLVSALHASIHCHANVDCCNIRATRSLSLSVRHAYRCFGRFKFLNQYLKFNLSWLRFRRRNRCEEIPYSGDASTNVKAAIPLFGPNPRFYK
jgi:hypothetical protein